MVSIVQEFEMGSSDDGYDGPIVGIYEPFSRLNEMDFELHGIYMDHEPKQESITRLNKSKDPFLNILLSDENIIISSMADEVKARVYHGNDLQNDEEAEEVVTDNYKIHDPNVRWDKIEPKLGEMLLTKYSQKAWDIVDVENTDNWIWFLVLLKDDVDLSTSAYLVVISDQHKGLLESVKVILPHVEHRQCARHIYACFGKAFSGLEFKKLL
ncbi:unnamed protein product [Lactuca saligna]|uniref:MULE transposase domain-containing protein n=1 Tax=Lactuca saligna TaxID=75948 RepID=A0AA36E9L6_LACSI|nr:unnamed protein product [Lactuca saligna]